MKLSSLGEFGLIEQIRKMTFRRSPSVLIGMGDDAAALKISSAKSLLATTDMLLEGIHFDLSYTDFYSLGWKSAAVNLSDVAAMGGTPRFCLTSLGIPSSVSVEHIKDFYRGFGAVLRAHGTVLVGGDTCSARKDFVVNVMVLGEAEKTELRTRAGARPGDRIFVTGELGDAAAGLELLKADVKRGASVVKRLIQKHLRPEPRVEWGRKIALSRCAHAMIDVSDGLSSDLFRICEQSGVGAVIAAEKIPLSQQLCKAAGRLGKPPVHYALSGGEDYELLCTVPPGKIGRLRKLGLPVTEIGEITRTRKVLIADKRGKTKPFKPAGFDHFAPSRP
jgi:thiamine-monophosphate kinase